MCILSTVVCSIRRTDDYTEKMQLRQQIQSIRWDTIDPSKISMAGTIFTAVLFVICSKRSTQHLLQEDITIDWSMLAYEQVTTHCCCLSPPPSPFSLLPLSPSPSLIFSLIHVYHLHMTVYNSLPSPPPLSYYSLLAPSVLPSLQFGSSRTAINCELRWKGHTNPFINRVGGAPVLIT